MGLIRTAINTVSGVISDQYKEYFYCEALDKTVLMIKGKKRTGSKSANNGSDNIISNGSVVAVADGQCMLIVEQGQVVEVCAEPGEFVYDTSTEPSIFTGDLKTSIVDTFKTMGKRFTFGNNTAKDQRVYYFNTKELVDNKFGTANPIPFRVVDRNINLDIDVSVRCNGVYSYKIVDPILFYTNVCGNVADRYTRDQLDSQLKAEFMNALQPAFAKISDLEIRPSAIPAHVTELTAALNENLTAQWTELRGLAVVSVAMNPVTLPEEDAEMIKQAQRAAIYRDPTMAAANLAGAQADAMKAAASNTAGAMTGFMGMNMASQAGGMNISGLYAMGQQQQQQAAAPAAGSWTCTCGKVNTGKFCAECGAAKPAPAGSWTCSCGAVNSGKFCAECGAAKPAAKAIKCDKCGWTPTDPTQTPKFCPECGDPINESDFV